MIIVTPANPMRRLTQTSGRTVLRNQTYTTIGINSGAAFESNTESSSGIDRTATKNNSWQIDPARLRNNCSQKCCVFRFAGPDATAAGMKTRKLIAYCRNSIIKAGAPEAALLKALIRAAQRKAIVISVIPSESL